MKKQESSDEPQYQIKVRDEIVFLTNDMGEAADKLADLAQDYYENGTPSPDDVSMEEL
tara:strand:- start:553 stop:726 length:174 start_codon:yes stop_codon:yes gene_type:complete